MNRNQGVACSREPLVDAIATFLARDHALGLSEIRASLARTIDDAGPTAIDGLGKRLASAGATGATTRAIRLRATSIVPSPVASCSTTRRARHRPPRLRARTAGRDVRQPPVVFRRQRHRRAAAEERGRRARGSIDGRRRTEGLSNLRRRFSSLCFGTIKVPQTSARSSDEAVMTPREVALAARRSIEVAHERLRLGEALLVFPEGTRSRTGRMQRLLTGAARYLEMPDTWVLPMGLVGTERLFPMSEDSNQSSTYHPHHRPAASGASARRAREGHRQLVMDEIGQAIAALLPPEYRGAYGDARETDGGSV